MNNGWMEIDGCTQFGPWQEKRLILVWHVYQGVMVEDAMNAGVNHFNRLWQEIPDRWIRSVKRLPTRMDADSIGCVVVRDQWGCIHMAGWFLIESHREYAEWMNPPGEPDGAKQMRKDYVL